MQHIAEEKVSCNGADAAKKKTPEHCQMAYIAALILQKQIVCAACLQLEMQKNIKLQAHFAEVRLMLKR